MNTLGTLYKSSWGLLTDLYQLTMAYGYGKCGKLDREAVFHLFFREHPFAGGFTVAAGLATAVFTVNCTSVAAGDTVVLSETSASAAAAATLFKVTGVAAGVFTITTLNTTAATADTGIPVWNYTVIKGSST